MFSEYWLHPSTPLPLGTHTNALDPHATTTEVLNLSVQVSEHLEEKYLKGSIVP